jgi:uncharacterized protein YjaZ
VGGHIELVVGRQRRVGEVWKIVRAPFEQAREVAERQLDASDIDVYLVDAPDECIPEWGLGGSAYGPHALVLCVDPDHEISAQNLFSTLVHEMHHVMRWRGPGCGSSLGDRLVSEGLAVAFEEECVGAVPMYGQGELSGEHCSLAVAALGEDPADEARWFFGGADLPRWFGYRFGYEVVSEQVRTCGLSAAELVHEPAATFWLGRSA